MSRVSIKPSVSKTERTELEDLIGGAPADDVPDLAQAIIDAGWRRVITPAPGKKSAKRRRSAS